MELDRSRRGFNGAVASADDLATGVGLGILRRGGNAVDAAIATNAAMAVVAPHMCGLGGDLFALVCHDGVVDALNASGRVGSGVDVEALRENSAGVIPFRHDINSVTIPGCADGWWALHQRYGSVPLHDLFKSAIELATNGFPASPLLVGAVDALDEAGSAQLAEIVRQCGRPGDRVCRPGVARTLETLGTSGRDGVFGGEFGEGLMTLGNGLYSAEDVAVSQATWEEPLSIEAFGVTLWTAPPNSQGYLALAAAAIAAHGDMSDPVDAAWAAYQIESSVAAAYDRPTRLAEGVDGRRLLSTVAARSVDDGPKFGQGHRSPGADGDTTYLCAVDGGGMAVSLIQSNAAGFGSWLVEPNTGINLHNRGIGFSLEPGHVAEIGPGRRPPHTLVPVAATVGERVRAVFGTMGGDAQPQIDLQLAVRLFGLRQPPQAAIDSGRWALRAESGFDTWGAAPVQVVVEEHAPPGWVEGLRERGFDVVPIPAYSSMVGHAAAITIDDDGLLRCGYDTRTVVGSAAAW